MTNNFNLEDIVNKIKDKELAIDINHIIRLDNSEEIVKAILKEISEKHFRNRPAMLDEFEHIVINFKKYIEGV